MKISLMKCANEKLRRALCWNHSHSTETEGIRETCCSSSEASQRGGRRQDGVNGGGIEKGGVGVIAFKRME